MRGLLSIAAKTIITLLLLWWLVGRIHLSAMLRHLSDVRLSTAVLALILALMAVVLATLRWRIVLRATGRDVGTWRLFRFSLIGFFFNQALPSAVGGDGMRVWLLYRDGCPLAAAFNTVLIDRVAGFVVLAVMSLYGFFFIAQQLLAVPPSYIIGIGCVMGIVAIASFFVLVKAMPRMERSRFGRYVALIVTDTMTLMAKPAQAGKAALFSTTAQLLTCAIVWLILRDLGAGVSVNGVMIVTPVVLLLLVLPISIAGWGLREGLFVLGFEILQVPQEKAFAASIIFGLLNLAVGLIGGIFWLLEPERSRRKASSIEASVEQASTARL